MFRFGIKIPGKKFILLHIKNILKKDPDPDPVGSGLVGVSRIRIRIRKKWTESTSLVLKDRYHSKKKNICQV